MRIEQLAFSNLNALKGHWQIDFTHPEYVHNGIFAITGPTGSGKTTILDAITLALYGRTPRLGKIGTNNEIMHKLCSSCHAEVTLSTPCGRYHVTWSQRRARGDYHGQLQPACHEIADADTGTIIDSTLRGTPEKVVALTGLDFPRFCRAVMLAQGQFSAFLHASDNERAPILEQITGTEVYADISRLVHQRYDTERRALEALVAQLDTIPLLTDDAFEALCSSIATCTEKTTLYEAEINRLRDLQMQHQQHQFLQRKNEQLRRELQKFLEEQQQFSSQNIQLRRHQQAQAGQTIFRLWEQANTITQNSADAVRSWAQKLEEVQIAHSQQQNHCTVAKSQLVAAQAQYDAAQHNLAQIQHLNVRITQLREQQHVLTSRLADLKPHLRDFSEIDLPDKIDIAQLEAALNTLLNGKSYEAWLQQLLEEKDYEHLLLQYLEAVNACENTQSQLVDLMTVLKKQQKQQITIETQLKEVQTQWLLAKDNSEKKHQHYKTQLAIENFSTYRTQLRDNHPCPLCGSIQHPYAHQHPVSSTSETDWHDALAQEKDYQKRYQQLKQDNNALCQAITDTQKSIQQLQKILDVHRAHLTSWREKLALSSSIEEALNNTQQTISAIQSRLLQIKTLDNQIKRVQWQALQKEQRDLTAQIQQIESQRQNLIPGNEADYETAVQQALNDAQKAHTTAQAHSANTELAVARISAQYEQAHQQLIHFQQEETHHYTALMDFLQTHHFADINAYKEALLSPRAVEKLQQTATRLQSSIDTLRAQLAESNTQLTSASVALNRIPPLTEIEENLNSTALAYRKLLERSGELRAQWQTEQQRRQQRNVQQAAIDQQQAVVSTWRKLHTLIGSAQGEKFRNFAQGLTLDVVLAQANSVLIYLSDRYSLVRSNTQNLTIELIDHYQGDDIRSSRNLSGGEVFIVSLALALGLSQIASRNVRIDSLFLDEGFGSLDAHMLDIALTTLTRLREQDKLIGVISHINAVNERISTKITVSPQGNGSSLLCGPGVRNSVL